MEQREAQARGWHQHFLGERRVDCESVPRLPACAVRWAIEDPLRRPYVFTWRDAFDELQEVATVALDAWPPAPWPCGPFVEVVRMTGLRAVIGTRYVPMPRGTGRDLLLRCFLCDRPRRFLYAWERRGNRVRAASAWQCRLCAGLRYVSEGNGRRAWGAYPRFPLDPFVFSSPEKAAEELQRI